MIFKTTNGVTEKWLKTNHIDYYNIIINYVKEEEISISERIFLYQNKLTEKPKCLNCDNKVNFIKFYRGYRKFCSKKCSAIYTHRDSVVKEKRIKKLLECNFIMKDEMVKKSIETKKSFSIYKKNSINDKRSETNIVKYGNKSVSSVEHLNIEKGSKISNKLKLINNNKIINSVNEIEEYSLKTISETELTIDCKNCGSYFIIKRYLFSQRKNFNKTICTNCNPTNNKSNFEDKVLFFIKENYNGEIKENKMFDKKYEIDIFLPDIGNGKRNCTREII